MGVSLVRNAAVSPGPVAVRGPAWVGGGLVMSGAQATKAPTGRGTAACPRVRVVSRGRFTMSLRTVRTVRKEITKNWCPRCDQGWILPCRIRANCQVVQVCGECHALWLDEEENRIANIHEMSAYLETLGLRGGLTELEPLRDEF